MNFVRLVHGGAAAARRPLIKFPQRHSVAGKRKVSIQIETIVEIVCLFCVALAQATPVIEPPVTSSLPRENTRPPPHKGKTVVLSTNYGRRQLSQEEILAINVSVKVS